MDRPAFRSTITTPTLDFRTSLRSMMLMMVVKAGVLSTVKRLTTIDEGFEEKGNGQVFVAERQQAYHKE